jgi:hypothetical protein
MSQCIPSLEVRRSKTAGGHSDIGRVEVGALVSQDRSLSWRDTCAVHPDKCVEFASLLPDGYVVWSAQPGGQEIWASFSYGRLYTSTVDAATIAKFRAIAGQLGARVEVEDCFVDNRIVTVSDQTIAVSALLLWGVAIGWLWWSVITRHEASPGSLGTTKALLRAASRKPVSATLGRVCREVALVASVWLFPLSILQDLTRFGAGYALAVAVFGTLPMLRRWIQSRIRLITNLGTGSALLLLSVVIALIVADRDAHWWLSEPSQLPKPHLPRLQ